jgi:hypothetical protein
VDRAEGKASSVKPRIALVHRIWECRLPDWKATRVIGFGFNPAQAYQEWLKCGGRLLR